MASKKGKRVQPEIPLESSDEESQEEKEIVYNQEKIEKRIAKIRRVNLKILNRFSSKQWKKIPWIEQMAVVSEDPLLLPKIENVNDDMRRELAIHNTTLECVKGGLGRLEKNKIPLQRPNDYFVEMFKNDEQMKLVKQKLMGQTTRIDKFEERKRRKSEQKFAKRIKAHKEQEKHKAKKKAMEEIEKWKKQQKSFS